MIDPVLNADRIWISKEPRAKAIHSTSFSGHNGSSDTSRGNIARGEGHIGLQLPPTQSLSIMFLSLPTALLSVARQPSPSTDELRPMQLLPSG